MKDRGMVPAPKPPTDLGQAHGGFHCHPVAALVPGQDDQVRALRADDFVERHAVLLGGLVNDDLPLRDKNPALWRFRIGWQGHKEEVARGGLRSWFFLHRLRHRLQEAPHAGRWGGSTKARRDASIVLRKPLSERPCAVFCQVKTHRGTHFLPIPRPA